MSPITELPVQKEVVNHTVKPQPLVPEVRVRVSALSCSIRSHGSSRPAEALRRFQCLDPRRIRAARQGNGQYGAPGCVQAFDFNVFDLDGIDLDGA
jgi:hypothetical protein